VSVYDFSVKRGDGSLQKLADYKGTVSLIVNTATKCGFATQFDGLESLYQNYAAKGFVVLGFPSDQFKQEPVGDAEMANICQKNFGVTFPLFASIDVNGKHADPLYTFLKQHETGLLGSSIKWNFTKFLVDQNGDVIKRYSPATEPSAIEQDIVLLLQKSHS
jgi:glutathione peroxidase